MADLGGYDANNHEPLGDFDPIPKGKYPSIATASEMKGTRNGDGQYLQIEWEVVDGDFKGRKLWSRLNLKNPNAKAVEIAQRELSSICRATGVMTPKDSAELHGIPVMLSVAVKKREDNGELTNEVKGYEAIGKTGQPQQQSLPQTGGEKPPVPWKQQR